MITNLLEGKKGIIFGALNNKSIAWHVAEKAHAQGARLVLTNCPCGHPDGYHYGAGGKDRQRGDLC